VHFHDLRHTGNNRTAAAGADLRELMTRMGHSSPRAALSYLHSIDERQREIADAMSDLAAQELERRTARRPSATATGTAAERRPVMINTTSCPTVPELVYSVSGAKVSSLRTWEWGVSGHRNAVTIVASWVIVAMAAACRRA
jgi:hypothetical protein